VVAEPAHERADISDRGPINWPSSTRRAPLSSLVAACGLHSRLQSCVRVRSHVIVRARVHYPMCTCPRACSVACPPWVTCARSCARACMHPRARLCYASELVSSRHLARGVLRVSSRREVPAAGLVLTRDTCSGGGVISSDTGWRPI
jgi:hypothetical protein